MLMEVKAKKSYGSYDNVSILHVFLVRSVFCRSFCIIFFFD